MVVAVKVEVATPEVEVAVVSFYNCLALSALFIDGACRLRWRPALFRWWSVLRWRRSLWRLRPAARWW